MFPLIVVGRACGGGRASAGSCPVDTGFQAASDGVRSSTSKASGCTCVWSISSRNISGYRALLDPLAQEPQEQALLVVIGMGDVVEPSIAPWEEARPRDLAWRRVEPQIHPAQPQSS
jgi:hypothetical protein